MSVQNPGNASIAEFYTMMETFRTTRDGGEITMPPGAKQLQQLHCFSSSELTTMSAALTKMTPEIATADLPQSAAFLDSMETFIHDCRADSTRVYYEAGNWDASNKVSAVLVGMKAALDSLRAYRTAQQADYWVKRIDTEPESAQN